MQSFSDVERGGSKTGQFLGERGVGKKVKIRADEELLVDLKLNIALIRFLHIYGCV